MIGTTTSKMPISNIFTIDCRESFLIIQSIEYRQLNLWNAINIDWNILHNLMSTTLTQFQLIESKADCWQIAIDIFQQIDVNKFKWIDEINMKLWFYYYISRMKSFFSTLCSRIWIGDTKMTVWINHAIKRNQTFVFLYILLEDFSWI